MVHRFTVLQVKEQRCICEVTPGTGLAKVYHSFGLDLCSA